MRDRVMRLAVVVMAIGLLLAAAPGRALAHAELESTDPASGAVLDEAPTSVTLTFSEPVEVSLGAVRLFDGSGTALDVGATEHPDGRVSAVRVSLPSIGNGSYVVDWRVVSADSHPIAGAFTFQVGPTSDLQPGILDEIIGRDHTGRPAGIGLNVSRGVVTAAMAVVLGGLAAVVVGAVEASRRIRRVLLAGAVAGGLAGLLQLPLEVGYATGRSLAVVWQGDAWSAALDTDIGVAWLVRALVLAGGGLGLVLTLPRWRTPGWRMLAGIILLAVGVASAYGGHGATGRWHAVGIVATVVHVGGMAVWLGGLACVVISVGSITQPQLRRFSTLAFGAMSAIVVSGAVQSVRQVGSFDALTNTTYGTLLIWKLVLVVVVLAIAALGRRLVRRDELDLARFRRAIGIEVVVAIAIVAVTSLLMAANPSQAAVSTPFSTTLIDDGYLASITVEPGHVGSNEMHVYLSSAASVLVEPDDVHAEISDPSRDVAPIDIPLTRSGAGHYTGSAATFPYAATWTLTITARYDEFDAVSFTAQVPIR